MSHITKEEYLSAFVDGEAGSFEQHRICDQLLTDEAMREKLSSFALIGEAVRNRSQDEASVANASFLSGIQDALANEAPLSMVSETEPAIQQDTIIIKKKRLVPKQAFGYAVAASVAAVAAISFQSFINTPSQSGQFDTAATGQNVEKIRASSVLPSIKSERVKVVTPSVQDEYFVATSFKAPDAQTRGLMNKYVAHHLQYASSSTLMPRVRAVSYKTDF